MIQLTDPLQIIIDPVTRSLNVGGITVFLSAKLLALYCFLACNENRCITVDSHFVQDINHARRYIDYVWYLRGDVRIYQTFGLEDEGDVIDGSYRNLRPLTAKFIQEVRAQIHAVLRRILPLNIKDVIKIHSDGVKGGCTYHIDPSLVILFVDNSASFHPRLSMCLECE